MNEKIKRIHRVLPITDAGTEYGSRGEDKALEVRKWITSVLQKMEHYIGQHRRLF
jgi:hypothetical protein